MSAAFLLGGSVNAVALSPPPPIGDIVLFDFDSARVNAAGTKIVAHLVSDVCREFGERYAVVVTGHADRAGPSDYNLALSLRRAEAVRDALVAAGIPIDVITIARRGETEPAVPTPDGVPEKANRRVEIFAQ
jgi:OOP family OmpA-OmpF porin